MANTITLETLHHLIVALDLANITEDEYRINRLRIEEITTKLSALRKSQMLKFTSF